jgi:hypothetical protein
MRLVEYVVALERSSKAEDQAVAAYIVKHRRLISGWLAKGSKGLGPADREQLTQTAMMACVEATRSNDPRLALAGVRTAIAREVAATLSWNTRRTTLTNEEN